MYQPGSPNTSFFWGGGVSPRRAGNQIGHRCPWQGGKDTHPLALLLLLRAPTCRHGQDPTRYSLCNTAVSHGSCVPSVP